MSTCTVATNNLFYKSYQLFKYCSIHDHFRALWHRQDCLEFVKIELRIQIAYIMLTQERGNKRSETLMLNSVSAKHFTFLPNHFNFISDTVTVCTLYHGEVRKWIPGGERVGLNGLGI